MDKLKKAILPVAGLGTRFLPATKAQPKEMLPIVDKPIIQFLVEEAVSSGIKEIIFVTGKGKRAIEDHFDYVAELEQELKKRGKKGLVKQIRAISDCAKFTYVRQKQPRGNADAILAAAHLIGNEPVAILYGDDLVAAKEPCLKQMIKVFEKYQDSVIALERVPKSEVSDYGIVDGVEIDTRLFEIKKIIEKPTIKQAPSTLAIVGKYIVTPAIFRELHNLKPVRQELYFTSALNNFLKKGVIYGYQFYGKRFDCGSKMGFLKATVEYGLEHRETREEFKKYLKGLKLN